MTVINTNGMSFIGPGSEWFWTALTGIVLAVTFIALYRQLRLQAHASAVEQLESLRRELFSEQMSRNVVEVLIALRDRKDPADLPMAAAAYLSGFWETFATLARTGHRDTKLLWQIEPDAPQAAWLWLAPWARKLRAESNNALFLENLEWLAGLLAKMDRRAGRSVVGESSMTSHRDQRIAVLQETIAAAQAMRTMVLTTHEPVITASSAPSSITSD